MKCRAYGRGLVLLGVLAGCFFAGCQDTVSSSGGTAAEAHVLMVGIAGESPVQARTALPPDPVSATYTISVDRGSGSLGSSTVSKGLGPYLIQLTAAPAVGDIVTVESFDDRDARNALGSHVLTAGNLDGTVAITVTLSPLPVGIGTGDVDLTVSFDPGAGVDEITKAELSLYESLDAYKGRSAALSTAWYGKAGESSGPDWTDFAGTSPEVIPINYTDLTSGNYVVKIDFYRGATVVSRLFQAVNVRGGLVTNRWVETTTGDTGNLAWNVFGSSKTELAANGITIDGTTIAGYAASKDSYDLHYKTTTVSPADKALIVTAGETGQFITAKLNTNAELALTSGVAFTLTPLERVNTLVITVTAPNGLAAKTYTVNISGKEIFDFSFTIDGKNYGVGAGVNVSGSGTIDHEDHTITVTVPYRTDLTALAPAITHSGVSIAPGSGAAQDFTSPVFYTVTGVDGATQAASYRVTVGTAKIASIKDINGNFTSPHGFVKTGLDISGAVYNAITPPVTGTDSLGTAIELAAADYSVDYLDPSAYGDNTATLRVSTASSTGAVTKDFTVYIKSWAKAITAFYFTIGGKKYGDGTGVESGSGAIDQSTHTITVTVPYDADPATFPSGGPVLTTYKPTVVHSGLSSIDPDDEYWDFSENIYTVTAEDGTFQNYTVTATVAEGITISAITNVGLSTLSFNNVPTSPVERGATINIEISGTVTEWAVDMSRLGTSSLFKDDLSPISFTTPSTPGFYNVSVLATVDGVLYSGSFEMVVK